MDKNPTVGKNVGGALSDAAPEKLDRPKKSSAGQELFYWPLEGLPDEVARPAVEAQQRRSQLLSEAQRKGLAKRKANLLLKRERMKAERGAAIDRQKYQAPTRARAGFEDRLRHWAVEREWFTSAAARVELGTYHGMVSQWMDRLWRRGVLEKQLNPERAANTFRVSGDQACRYRYRLVESERLGDQQPKQGEGKDLYDVLD